MSHDDLAMMLVQIDGNQTCSLLHFLNSNGLDQDEKITVLCSLLACGEYEKRRRGWTHYSVKLI